MLEGYWDQPEATADAIVDGWFHTGDGGTIDDEGYLSISDRKKDVIISGGENVSSIEVEDALASHPDVAEVAVIGVPDEKWGETVKALVVLVPGPTATEADLIEHCRGRLAHFECPTSVEVRDELARTATGKLQKFKLRAPVLGRAHPTGRMMRHRNSRIRRSALVAVVALAALAMGPARAVATAPTTVPTATPAPGGSVAWAPQGRQVLGRPVLYTGSANGAFVAWMDPELTRPAVVPGTGDPLGTPWGGQVAPDQQPFLVSSFNGGFKWGDFDGGVLAFGASYRSPVPGEASFIVYSDGTYTVGAWGRDNDPSKQVTALRQNLGMLVDGGAPTPAASNPGAWGASVAGVATARGAVGVDANGGLVWAGGRLSPLDLANALVAGRRGARHAARHQPRLGGLQLVRRRPRQVAHGNGLYGATGADRYLHPDGRDFIAMFVRGTVVAGATRQARGGAARRPGHGEVVAPSCSASTAFHGQGSVTPWRSRGASGREHAEEAAVDPERLTGDVAEARAVQADHRPGLFLGLRVPVDHAERVLDGRPCRRRPRTRASSRSRSGPG